MKQLSNIALRLLWVIIASVGGWLLYLINVNLMIYTGFFAGESVSQGAGYVLVEKVVIVWAVSSLLCLGSIFTQSKTRLVFLSLPIILPTVFSLIYILSL
ncbi:MAG: hypothetical protein AAGB32_05445 [Pseudomonadota bacterium]